MLRHLTCERPENLGSRTCRIDNSDAFSSFVNVFVTTGDGEGGSATSSTAAGDGEGGSAKSSTVGVVAARAAELAVIYFRKKLAMMFVLS